MTFDLCWAAEKNLKRKPLINPVQPLWQPVDVLFLHQLGFLPEHLRLWAVGHSLRRSARSGRLICGFTVGRDLQFSFCICWSGTMLGSVGLMSAALSSQVVTLLRNQFEGKQFPISFCLSACFLVFFSNSLASPTISFPTTAAELFCVSLDEDWSSWSLLLFWLAMDPFHGPVCSQTYSTRVRNTGELELPWPQTGAAFLERKLNRPSAAAHWESFQEDGSSGYGFKKRS